MTYTERINKLENKQQENVSAAHSNQSTETASFEFQDNRATSLATAQLQTGIQNSPHVTQMMNYQKMADQSLGINSKSSAPESDASEGVVQRHLLSFLGLFSGGDEDKKEFVPKSDTTAFTKDKAAKIDKSITAAYKMVKKAQGKIDKNNSRYKRFMDAGKVDKENQDARVEHVKSGFDKIEQFLLKDKITFKKYALDDGEEESTYAYVYPGDGKSEIFLGGSYWDAKMKGYDSKAGTIIHEMTHELHGTADHGYGVKNSKLFAKTDPAKATTNADNYEHFAEKA